MRGLTAFAALMSWAAVYGVLVHVTGHELVSAVVVLTLTFREELSIALRYRRVIVDAFGFKGSIDGARADPPEGS